MEFSYHASEIRYFRRDGLNHLDSQLNDLILTYTFTYITIEIKLYINSKFTITKMILKSIICFNRYIFTYNCFVLIIIYFKLLSNYYYSVELIMCESKVI